MIHIDDEAHDLAPGDSVVVPTGAWHLFEAGPDGATLAVTMLAGTKLIPRGRQREHSSLGRLMAAYVAGVPSSTGGRSRRSRASSSTTGRSPGWAARPCAEGGAHGPCGRAREGATLTPGLIDCHVHLQFDGAGDFAAEARALTPAMAALKAAANLRRHLANGVTTVRDLGGLDAVSCEVGRAVDEGMIADRRCWPPAGPSRSPVGTATTSRSRARSTARTPCARPSGRRSAPAPLAIKVVATGGVLTPGIGATFTAYTPEELGAAVDEAHKWDRGVAAHAIGAEGILSAVRAGVDSIEHCNFLTAEAAREMKERGTFRSPTLCAIRGILEHPDEVPATPWRRPGSPPRRRVTPSGAPSGPACATSAARTPVPRSTPTAALPES